MPEYHFVLIVVCHCLIYPAEVRFEFLWRWLWRFLSFGMWRRVVLGQFTKVSEELSADIFRMEE